MKTIILIPGDGIGTEIVGAVKEIFAAANANVIWEEHTIGQLAYDSTGSYIPDALINALRQHKVGLKGPAETPVGKGFKSVNVQLRQLFDLYANVRPCKNIAGVETRFEGVDLVLFRENTEGLYSGISYYDERLEIADSISRVTKRGCERIVNAAFKYAHTHGRKKVTVIHKANILKHSGKLFLDAAAAAAAQYPHIEVEDKIIDNMAMQLVRNPERFDVLVTSNLFGDILSDLCAGLVGGLGVVSGANIGDEYAVFEAVHGTAPDIAGRGIANPTAILRSAIMMLEHIGEQATARKIDDALVRTLAVKELCTGDLGGKASTAQFAQHVVNNL